MTTQELIAENTRLQKRAALWKRCAKCFRWRAAAAAENANQLDRSFKNACRAADKAEAEFDRILKAARLLAEKYKAIYDWTPLQKEVREILEATKEKP